ncbi:hypothetical protein Pmar_PMAR009849 [Perkinsus marinus ATCC 50983]|uniref:Uncharacterized protein n=1 Tax=Perkinsus marinus (strain ATCC 50983 / TXsc) TaxID=423536 RepID=C5KV88_PERM5|nr:hypothetical protein Pmar_PMAR009849 [Perkinsus marinus ATCC 50983]EER11634.1 hypothetical protein Pmar_PMAR009849 [Perkinsus marinus ATCC 50983]|eukprot:XP_002779839.1 hypothetical protein Pmar_PMAR009849 [Perkinsus marinus ATCC 50983]
MYSGYDINDLDELDYSGDTDSVSLLYKDAAAVVDKVILHGVGLREAFYKSKLKMCKTVKSRAGMRILIHA